MKKPKVIFFDVGGTLLRVAQPVGEIYAALGWNYGQRWDALALQQGFKAAWKKLRPRQPGTIPVDGDDRGWWRQVVDEVLTQVEVPETFPRQAYFEELYERFADVKWWRVFPEVFPVLDHLREQGYRMAIMSNWDGRLPGMLEQLELSPYFEKSFISGQLGFEKPQPEIYQHACDVMGLQPAEAWLVGDDPQNDDSAPRTLGWGTFLVQRPQVDLTSLLDVLTKN
jgi:putative hydrolase of the HAD superfamily